MSTVMHIQLDYCGAIAPDTPMPTIPDLYLPRNRTPELEMLTRQYNALVDDIYEDGLYEDMAKDHVQVVRSVFCLIEEAMILRDYRLFSAAAINCINKNMDSMGLTIHIRHQRMFHLSPEILRIIRSYFLPAVQNKKSQLRAHCKYFVEKLGYHKSRRWLIICLLAENVTQRLERKANHRIFHCYTEGSNIRPCERHDELTEPFRNE